jgi:hypothetical protein
MRNLWCLEKISILPLIISATGIVPQSIFKNLKFLDLENTLVVEIQKGILLYSCHIVRKFLNIDTEALHYYLIVFSVIVYVLRQNCRAAGWWRVKYINHIYFRFISLKINTINLMFSFKKTMSMHTSNYNISKQPLIKKLPLNVIKKS